MKKENLQILLIALGILAVLLGLSLAGVSITTYTQVNTLAFVGGLIVTAVGAGLMAYNKRPILSAALVAWGLTAVFYALSPHFYNFLQ